MVRDFASEAELELDILIKFSFGGREYRTVVECRERTDATRKQGSDWIRELAMKRDNCRLDRIVAASSTGFTPAALKAAKANNVETICVQEATETQWREKVTPDLCRISFHTTRCQLNEPWELTWAASQSPPLTGAFSAEDCQIVFPDGSSVPLAQLREKVASVIQAGLSATPDGLVVQELPQEEDKTEKIDFVVDFPEGTKLVLEDGRESPLQRAAGTGTIQRTLTYMDGRKYSLYGDRAVLEASGQALDRQVQTTTVVSKGEIRGSVAIENAQVTPGAEQRTEAFTVHVRLVEPGSPWVRCSP